MKNTRSYAVIFQVLPFLFHAVFPCSGTAGDAIPPVTLARNFSRNIAISHYWVSEKLDGVRAYWDGRQLVSRQGNVFSAPEWFTRGFPEQELDGELWAGRQQFQSLMSIVTSRTGDGAGWQRVRYCVFDLPSHPGTFSQRLAALRQLQRTTNQPYFKIVEQFRVQSIEELMQRLDALTAAGGEGLMLQRADALHATGRSDHLLKLKRYQDAEARVIRHLPGKGKYTGMLGALLVENDVGLQFRIGTGFSDAERHNPPAIGSLITYKYYGKTRRGIPRFASFMRIRQRP